MSARSIKIIYTLSALVVFGICFMNFSAHMLGRGSGNDQCRWIVKGESRMVITDIISGGVADLAGLRDGDVLVKIDGESIKDAAAAQKLIDKKVGAYSVYTIERDGELLDRPIFICKLVNLLFLSQFLFGLGFLIVGYVVVMAKPQGKIQQMFARYSILSMLFFGLAVLNLDPAIFSGWQRITLIAGFVAATVFALPIFIRFFLFFPVKRKGSNSILLAITLHIVSIGIAAAIFGLPKGENFLPVLIVAFVLRYVFIFIGFGFFIHSYFRLVSRERRIQLFPVLISIAISLVLFMYGLLIQTIDPIAAFLKPSVVMPLMLLVVSPAFFGYAIFRHRLMDIDVIIRRSLIYGAVTALLAAVYLVSVYGIGTLVNYFFGEQNNQILIVVSLVVVAFVFDPVKQKMQSAIDRVFFHERYDYQRALLDFTQELPRLMEMEHILKSIISRLSSTMHIEKISVFICGEKGGCKAAAHNLEKSDCEFKTGKNTLMALLEKTRKPADLHLLGDEYDATEINDEEKQKLLRSGIVLSVPMFLQDRLVGFINVGPKMSGKIYSQEDINLLATVAGQAAIAIENSRLHKSEIEQGRIKEELDLAKKIQQGLFPKKSPQVPGLDITGISVPASSVGGDYYDFIQLGPKKVLVVAADVSGKGMSAALYMSKIQGMVQLSAHMYNTPKEMLININRRIFEGLDRKSFITMILALFDMKKKEVRICRAGHNKALYSKNGKVRSLEGGGIGLGLERGPMFENAIEEVRLPVKSGSLFLFYTDGITEAMNEKKQQLGERAVIDILKTKKDISAEGIQKAILSRVEKFRGSAEQHDDVTMVVVKSVPVKK